MKKRRAFTAAELIISLLVMSITYAAMSLSSASAKQTAQHEAERLAASKITKDHSGLRRDANTLTISTGLHSVS